MDKDIVFRSDLLTSGGGHFLQSIQLQEMQFGTCYAKAIPHKNKIYVCGGSSEGSLQYIVQVYNTLKKEWSKLPPSHSQSGVAIVEEQLTLIGGYTSYHILSNKLMTWTGKEWQELYPPMHTARFYSGVLAIENLVIVSGGYVNTNIDTIECLDIKNKMWIQSNLKLPQPLSLHHMALCGEYIYIYHSDHGFWRMNKKDFMASLTSLKPVAQEWERLEDAPSSSSLLSLSMQPLLVGPSGIFTYEKKWTQISEVTSYDHACAASLNEKTFLTFGGKGKGEYQTSAVQYDIVEVEDTSLKEQDKKDASLKEQDKKDASLKDELANLKDEYSSFKEKELKEKQTLIDQVERLKQSEREYELKVQELMERNTQLKTEVADSSSKGTETQQKNIERLEERIAEVARELRDTQKDNQHLKERNTDLKESNTDLKESNIELKESISELKKTNSNLNSQTTEKMAKLNRELKDAQTNVEKLEVSKVHLEERINDLKKTNSLLEEGNSDLKTRLQQQQQSTERVTELQEENIKLREEKSFLEGSLKETEERRNALEEEKAKTEKQAEELRSNMLGKVEGFGAMLEEMKKSLDVLEEKQNKDELMRTELKTRHMAVVQRTIIDEVPQKWKGIATYLEFELNKIEIVGAKKNDKEKCYEMLAEWLKHAKGSGELPRTLKSLHNALVDRDCRPEADKLVEEVKRMMK